MKLHKRLCCLLLVLVCLCVPVLAAQSSGLTIHYAQNGTPLVGATFSLYLVAQTGENGEPVLTEAFSKYHINFSDDPSHWPALASTLAFYAAYGQIPPVRQGQTDLHGFLDFYGLSDGIYLVVGHLHRQGGLAYTAEPALVSLSGSHVEIFPKAEWVPDGGGDGFEEETVKVLKVWDDGNAETRPETVTVHLLQDGLVYSSVTLQASNRWSYTWQGLPASHDYAVVEDVTEGYTVTVKRQGITFVVTNTATEEPPQSEEPEDFPETIPETGQPWAYVLLLTAAGLLFLVIGLYIRRGEDHEA